MVSATWVPRELTIGTKDQKSIKTKKKCYESGFEYLPHPFYPLDLMSSDFKGMIAGKISTRMWSDLKVSLKIALIVSTFVKKLYFSLKRYELFYTFKTKNLSSHMKISLKEEYQWGRPNIISVAISLKQIDKVNRHIVGVITVQEYTNHTQPSKDYPITIKGTIFGASYPNSSNCWLFLCEVAQVH